MSNPTKTQSKSVALTVLAAYGLEIGSSVSTDYGYGRAEILAATLVDGQVMLKTTRGTIPFSDTFAR